MKNYTLLLFPILLIAFLSSCNNSSEMKCHDDGGMAQFVNDDKFKSAHEIPQPLDLVERGKPITYDTPDGKTASAYFLKAEEESDKYIFVIHEWWGLNNHIKQEAERLFDSLDNVNVMALDLYDGKVATIPKEAETLVNSVVEERANAIINGALAYAGEEAKVATIGWCFGGSWSLKASILAGEQGAACVIFY